MRRIVLAAGMAMAGCGSSEDLATMRVDRWTADLVRGHGGCFAPCEGFEGTPTLLPGCQPEVPVVCGFMGGEDRMRIQAVFEEGIPETSSGDLPVQASLYADGRLLLAQDLTERQRADEGPAEAVYMQLIMPSSSSPGMSELEVELTVSSRSAPMTLEPSSFLRVNLAECPSDPVVPCALAQGIGAIHANIEVPQTIPGTRANLVSTTGEVAVVPLTDDPEGEIKRGQAVFSNLPEAVGTLVSISGSLGDFALTGRDFTIAAAEPMELRVLPATGEPLTLERFAMAAPMTRSTLEVDPGCQRVWVVARAPSVPPGLPILVTASAGQFANGSSSTELYIEGAESLGYVEFTPPSEGAAEPVQFEARYGAWPPVPAELATTPVPAVEAELYATVSQLSIDAQGSPAATLSGWLTPPEGAMFPASQRIGVRVEAIADRDAELPCSPRLHASALACDPSDRSGACLLAPPEIEVGPTGYFSFNLQTGLCFAGRVTISLDLPFVTPTQDACIGEWPVLTTPETATFALGFIPTA